jgi:hypothetical protein
MQQPILLTYIRPAPPGLGGMGDSLHRMAEVAAVLGLPLTEALLRQALLALRAELAAAAEDDAPGTYGRS